MNYLKFVLTRWYFWVVLLTGIILGSPETTIQELGLLMNGFPLPFVGRVIGMLLMSALVPSIMFFIKRHKTSNHP